jgi:hypothetical protein
VLAYAEEMRRSFFCVSKGPGADYRENLPVEILKGIDCLVSVPEDYSVMEATSGINFPSMLAICAARQWFLYGQAM